jgi:hypothetical protein
MIDLAPRLARLEALRSFLLGASHDDLDLIVTITKEGIRRGGPSTFAIAAVLDKILEVDPRFAAGPLAAAARAAGQAVEAVRLRRH